MTGVSLGLWQGQLICSRPLWEKGLSGARGPAKLFQWRRANETRRARGRPCCDSLRGWETDRAAQAKFPFPRTPCCSILPLIGLGTVAGIRQNASSPTPQVLFIKCPLPFPSLPPPPISQLKHLPLRSSLKVKNDPGPVCDRNDKGLFLRYALHTNTFHICSRLRNYQARKHTTY